jgi:transposase-like protein
MAWGSEKPQPERPLPIKAKRRRHDTGFKARVGLEALKAQKTTQQIAGQYEAYPTQFSKWKKTLSSEGLGAAFQKGKGGVRVGAREAAFQDRGADSEAGFSKKNPDSSACEPCRAGRKQCLFAVSSW